MNPLLMSTLRTAFCGVALSLLIASPGLPLRAQPFAFSFVEHRLEGVELGALVWADFNGDANFDVFLSGNTGFLTEPVLAAGLYLNGGNGIRTTEGGVQIPTTEYTGLEAFPGVPSWHSAVAAGDYDRDGDLDLLVSGAAGAGGPYRPVLRLYRNEGGANGFSELIPDLPAVYGGAVAWGDCDNDGAPDLLLTGIDEAGIPIANVYRNRGDGSFTEHAALEGVAYGAVAWSDYDGDGDLDFALSGITRDGPFVSRVYRNDGGGVFTDLQAGLPGLAYGAVAWGDYDGDGDPDLLLSGGRLSPYVLGGVTRLYRNASGRFEDAGVALEGAVGGTAAWGDYDNDGDLDLLLTGAADGIGRRIGRIYKNEGGQQFRYAANLPSLFPGFAAWGDYDGDNDLDLLVMGHGSNGLPVLNQYQNTERIVNAVPAAPGGLQASTEEGRVTLRWEAASDEGTPVSGLTYNVRVGTTPGGVDVVSPLAAPASGRRWIAASGNAGQRTHYVLEGLSAGTYYWSVQALDPSFAGSPFAGEATFTTDAAQGDVATGKEPASGLPDAYGLGQNYPNPFAGRTTIRYALPEGATVRLEVYNVLGGKVRTLVHGREEAGLKEIAWDARSDAGAPVAPGLYLYRLEAEGGFAASRKMMLLR